MMVTIGLLLLTVLLSLILWPRFHDLSQPNLGVGYFYVRAVYSWIAHTVAEYIYKDGRPRSKRRDQNNYIPAQLSQCPIF